MGPARGATVPGSLRLEPAGSYRGHLRIEHKSPGGGLSGKDVIIFETGDLRVRFGPNWRSC